jgi:DNA gyrase subunit A
MEFSRPNLNNIPAEVRTYIESLEAEIARLQRPAPGRRDAHARSRPESEDANFSMDEAFETAEPPTNIQMITMTASGYAKRTQRHLYNRQRRGGIGIFDLESPNDEPPAILSVIEENQNLLVFTNMARAFRVSLSTIPSAPVRSRGESIIGRLNLLPDEKIASILPDRAQGYIAFLGQNGGIRMLRHHVFGEYMKPGTSVFDPRPFGPLISASWTPGDSDLLITTRQGKAIRFAEKLVPPPGGLGIRLSAGDQAVAVSPVNDESRVFLLTSDGKGTIRLMDSFTSNKAPGAGGKYIMTTDELITSFPAQPEEDIFAISRLGKIIRFNAAEVPAKDGVVQGVICMSFRSDDCRAAVAATPIAGD